MVPKQRAKSTQLMQWAAAGLLAASLSGCSAAGIVSQVQSRINAASNPQAVALQTTAQPAASATPTTTTNQNVVTTSQDQLYEALYTQINPSVVNITVI